MKKQLLALSMVAASGLFAQGDASMQNNNGYEQSGCCNTCGCNPCCCCVPKPKKCIDCECYTPAFYDLQCDWGFKLDLEFLYWYGRETNLSYASRINMAPANVNDATSTTIFAADSYRQLGTSWDPGFRVGIGWNSCCDGWDYNLTWTWYRNQHRNSTSVPQYGTTANPNIANVGQEVLVNPWINQSWHQFVSSVVTFDKVSAKWRFLLNQIDLDVGRKYWLSKCFNLRPYAGLRGAWTNVKFATYSHRSYTDAADIVETYTYKDNFKSKMWGVGFVGGLQPAFYWTQCFALYANMDSSLIWGDFQVNKRENYLGYQNGVLTAPNYSNRSSNKFAQMTAILDLGLGVRWETTWCCDRYRSAVDLGWEHHIYFDQNHRNKTFVSTGIAGTNPATAGYQTYAEATGNVGFGGFVLRANFDF